MYLKSIEIQGFKSFANKIVFEFHNGITGIVGPNGSGKSNVSDAVRWVLGEQSAKQLRGGNMQDVIFAGTELRKPQGFAYVAITLDNSDRALSIDYDEVKVSRRLYRSGESEYKINGSNCRLKDINELFFDTGIGQEGYSIIGQGQIERILSGKPEERRELFDEAAGITKFRKRKTLAERKLENERAGLLRVKDILSELEKQVGPLERQAKAAKEYLDLRDRLRSADLNLFLMEAASCKEELTELSKREQILSDDEAAAKQAETDLKEAYQEIENVLSAAEQEIEAVREQIGGLQTEESRLTGQINILKEQIRTERINAEHYNERRKAIETETAEKTEELSARRKEKEETDREAGAESRESSERALLLNQKDSELRELTERIDRIKLSVIDAINEKADVSARGQRYEAMLEQIRVRDAEVSQRLLRFQTDSKDLDRTIEAAEEKKVASEETLKQAAEEKKAAEEALKAAGEEKVRLENLLRNIQSMYQTDAVRLESLKNLAERYDGYGNAIRRVMETKERVKGIRGVVADLISVEKKYEIAIETALGGRIQNIVTDTEETAKELIEYLKRNRYGRATFLPLTSAGNAKEWDPGDILREEGVIGTAASLTDTASDYKGIVRSLLGRDIVVSNIDLAIRLARKYHYSFRIVTLEGELLNPGGAMSGGAFRNSSNLLGRKREIEELEEDLKRIEKQTKRTAQAVQDASDEKIKAAEYLESLRAAEQDALLASSTAGMELNALIDKRNELLRSAKELMNEHAQIEAQIAEIGGGRKSLEEELSALDEKKIQLEKEAASLGEVLEKERAEREVLASSFTDAQLRTSAAMQKASYLNETIRRLSDELNKLAIEKETISNGTGDADAKIAEKEKEVTNTEALREANAAALEAAKEKLRGMEAERETKRSEQRRYFSRRDEITERLTALDRDLFRVRGRIEKTEEKLNARTGYVLSEYNLSMEGAEQYRLEVMPPESELKKQTEELKRSIRALGNVNINAIEDYKNISERYTFMTTQYEDLHKAEAALVEVIAALDKGMRKQFAEEFGRIREEFNRVFRELFGGGKGELKLDEEADILEAQIAIIAEPPGKKLQNMMQLSGGEKALTAIALLFAIQNLKPSPFALLDEIEAALDDSNVDRFAAYLKKLTENTQFIVITHRRGTMVGADRLYGITMQEKGVSTLVSVNLIEDSLDR